MQETSVNTRRFRASYTADTNATYSAVFLESLNSIFYKKPSCHWQTHAKLPQVSSGSAVCWALVITS